MLRIVIGYILCIECFIYRMPVSGFLIQSLYGKVLFCWKIIPDKKNCGRKMKMDM